MSGTYLATTGARRRVPILGPLFNGMINIPRPLLMQLSAHMSQAWIHQTAERGYIPWRGCCWRSSWARRRLNTCQQTFIESISPVKASKLHAMSAESTSGQEERITYAPCCSCSSWSSCYTHISTHPSSISGDAIQARMKTAPPTGVRTCVCSSLKRRRREAQVRESTNTSISERLQAAAAI